MKVEREGRTEESEMMGEFSRKDRTHHITPADAQ